MNEAVRTTTLVPLALKDAPALIESVFPAQKVSFEAQTERGAGRGQTLTSIGSYWKGRKPLILVRSIVLGSLLPPTNEAEADLSIFEKLMAFDEESLARRAFSANAFSASDLQTLIPISDPERYFSGCGWRRDVPDEDKLALYRRALATFTTYEEKAALCKRPEEVDQNWLYEPVWPAVNEHYAHLGVKVHSMVDVVRQFGLLRYGHAPRVGDTFCGGGSIPFEAARLGCDIYASDLNPIACMLTWGAINVIGASPERREEIEKSQDLIADLVDKELTELGVEQDSRGNRAKSYLYCLETRCPETGWMVPMIQDRIISKNRSVIATLEPDHDRRRFNIIITEGVSATDLKAAKKGTVQGGDLVYELDGVTYRHSIKTLRGDYRGTEGKTQNRLRLWNKNDFKPRPDDIFQERLYAIQWIKKETLKDGRQETFFSVVTDEDIERELKVESIVSANLARWQEAGWVPDMAIEPGDKTDELIRTRGWAYWHHLYTPRNLLFMATIMRHTNSPELGVFNCGQADWNSKKVRWDRISLTALNAMTDQALDTNVDWLTRSSYVFCHGRSTSLRDREVFPQNVEIRSLPAAAVSTKCEMFITDPPYADAVSYHEITEYFIAWLRKNPPKPFDEWVWDSRRVLAIKGSGEDFRRGMVAAYKAMADHTPDNGMQCVMFTHQDTGVWSDMVGIFWAAGLQVVAAWYIATETTSELKKGGYVQGTVILMLKKRATGDRAGFKQRILPAVRSEVQRQIETMMHLNDEVKNKHGEPVFNDSDLQMAGYAAALKVLTAYTQIGGEDVTAFALRPRVRGENTVVDEIVQQAAEAANSLLVPEGLAADTWAKLTGIERFMLRMMDMETTGAAKLDNYQNFAKAFRVEDYSRVMGSMAANQARLKRVSEFASRDLTDSTELGATRLGRLIIGVQQVLAETEPQAIVSQLQAEMADFLEVRSLLVDLLAFIERKAPEEQVRAGAEVLGARLKNLRFGA